MFSSVDLGDVQDILNSLVLDVYDLDLDLFGLASETKYSYNGRSPGKPKFIYNYKLPDDQDLYLDGNNEEYPLSGSLYEPKETKEFVIIQLSCEKDYFLDKIELITDSIKSSVTMIKSMFGLKLVDLSDSSFKNSITYLDYSDIIYVSWDDFDISKFRNGFGNNWPLMIQIFLSQ
jgi:hypothetical protein